MSTQQHPDWVIAVLAGVLSFLSPCILPLLPGYLSMISGLSFEQLTGSGGEGAGGRRAHYLMRVLVSCLLFSVGFAIVFVLLGTSAGLLGTWLITHVRAINLVMGIVVIVFGLALLKVVPLPFLTQTKHIQVNSRLGLAGAPLLGMAFAFGWSPCIGAWLSALYTVAANRTPLQAAWLFAIFSASLAFCFTAAGVLFALSLRTFSRLQRMQRAIEIVSGIVLIAVGALLATQQFNRFSSMVMAWMDRLF